LPLQRPRRIFRSSPAVVPSRRVFGVLATGITGGVALVLLGLIIGSTDLFGRAAPPLRAIAADAWSVAVVDGDTLRLRETVVRLLGVQAPERGQTCHGRDGSGFDCGVASANALADLVREHPVDCQLRGQDPMGRALAVCSAAGRDLNVALVAGGWARAGGGLPELASLEHEARAGHRGLWASDGL
jgi:endonuclease YncB( thermonuclease family)